MLASVPANMLNQNSPDLGIPNRIDLKTSRSSLQGFRQRSASFGIVEIPNIPKVPKVKWNIVLALRD